MVIYIFARWGPPLLQFVSFSSGAAKDSAMCLHECLLEGFHSTCFRVQGPRGRGGGGAGPTHPKPKFSGKTEVLGGATGNATLCVLCLHLHLFVSQTSVWQLVRVRVSVCCLVFPRHCPCAVDVPLLVGPQLTIN